jgi:hypothetical protein
MPQTATIKSLPAAFAMMKAMQAEGIEWGEDYRLGARDALHSGAPDPSGTLGRSGSGRSAATGAISIGEVKEPLDSLG